MGSRTISIDSNYVKNIYNKYALIHTNLSGNTIDLRGEIKGMYSNSVGSFSYNESLKEISTELQNIRKKISQTMQALNDLEGGIDVSAYYSKHTNSKEYIEAKRDINGKLRKMDLASFQKYYGDKCFKKNGKWYIRVNNYTYNITNGYLTDNKTKKGIKVEFYAPENCQDLSKLNTVTTFSGSSINDSGSIVIKPTWNNNKKMVVAATDFMNKLAKTDLKQCHNTIMGGSKYGSYSLQIAAENGNLYDTVVCINASAIVGGENAGSGGRIQFKNVNALKKLNGKKIYFVIADGEPNMYKHAGENNGWENCSTTESYLYTGLQFVSKYCPKSQVYMVTNANEKVFKGIKYKNYHYDSNMWEELGIDASYSGHAYEEIINDILNGPLCN